MGRFPQVFHELFTFCHEIFEHDFSCDSPWEVVEDALRAARRDHPQIDMVYITGDYIDHGIWETSREGNIIIFDRFYDMVKQVFAGVPVFPVLGNHEGKNFNLGF